MVGGNRLLIDIIDWGYPQERVPFRPTIIDLSDTSEQMKLVLGFGNGIFNEIRAVGETQAAIEAFRLLATGVGSCEPVQHASLGRDLWFHVDGDECLRQGSGRTAAIVMIDPVPRPEMFGRSHV